MGVLGFEGFVDGLAPRYLLHVPIIGLLLLLLRGGMVELDGLRIAELHGWPHWHLTSFFLSFFLKFDL